MLATNYIYPITILDMGNSFPRSLQASSILFISYDSGASGSVTSEWVEDKLRSLRALDFKVWLVTAPSSSLKSESQVRISKPFSLSWLDFLDEKLHSPNSIWTLMNLGVSASLGRLFDLVFRVLAGTRSYGRWSWIFCAFPVALYASIKGKSKIVFSTGGPSSAHFIALLVKLCRPSLQLYVELQDPFIGSEMPLNSRSIRVLIFLEALLIKYSTKVVFVTHEGANRARARHSGLKKLDAIKAIYPGSWDFLVRAREDQGPHPGDIRILHLGSLYTNRNLDLLFESIDRLKKEGVQEAKRIRVINLGGLYLHNSDSYRRRSDFEEIAMQSREAALRFASSAHLLLLVQHADSRSEETIPYKTYDYLNLGIPILGLINSEELGGLLNAAGGFVGSSTEIDIALSALRSALDSLNSVRAIQTSHLKFNSVDQLKLIFN
jgi:glycosyltransferase involved in cell wall biosynthesis